MFSQFIGLCCSNYTAKKTLTQPGGLNVMRDRVQLALMCQINTVYHSLLCMRRAACVAHADPLPLICCC